MKIAIVRGAFLNQFEMQSFVPLAKEHNLTAFSSLKPIHDKVGFPVVKLPSPMDLIKVTSILNRIEVKGRVERVLRGVVNRVLIDGHYLFNLEKQLQGFDIAHCAETYFHYTQQCLNAKKGGGVKKVVCSVSETIPFNNEGIWGRKKFKKRAIKEVDLFLARTKLAKETLMIEGCDPKKIAIVPHGINVNKFKNKKLNIKKTYKKLKILKTLFVGRLEEEKGIKELVRVFQQLNIESQQLSVKLKIVGKGSLERWIKYWIERNKQEDNVIVEQYAYQEMPKVYQEADIFVLPSKKTKYWQEHFGMVLIEAMASSLPIVATKSGAIPEVVGKCGLLVEEGDVKGLCLALKKLIENRSLRIKLGKIGRKRVEKYFDSQQVAKKTEEIYQRLLSAREI